MARKKLFTIAITVIIGMLFLIQSPPTINAATIQYLVVVHGCGDTVLSSDMQGVLDYYKGKYGSSNVYAPEYYLSAVSDGEIDWNLEHDKSIATYASIVYNKLVTFFKNKPNGRVDIVAHSMGGLIVRYMLTHLIPHSADNSAFIIKKTIKIGDTYLTTYSHKIDDIVFIGSPHKGTPWANALKSAILAQYSTDPLYGYMMYQKLIPRQVREMEIGSLFLSNLNKYDTGTDNLNRYVLAGRGGPLEHFNIWGIDIPQWLISAATSLVFFGEANDGVVGYSSAISVPGRDGLKVYDIYDHIEIFTLLEWYCYYTWLKS